MKKIRVISLFSGCGGADPLSAVVKFTTEDVLEVLGYPLTTLVDLTRSKRGNAPLFTPTWQSTSRGRGNPDLYSFGDLVILSVFRHTKLLGVPRKWISEFVSMAKNLGRGPNKDNPLHLDFDQMNTPIILAIQTTGPRLPSREERKAPRLEIRLNLTEIHHDVKERLVSLGKV